ncbi:hypothetical protein BM1_08799 [Bipolaris maydis]|nr:hypothetical protein BM1_08799 [Bipolaris maydis]
MSDSMSELYDDLKSEAQNRLGNENSRRWRRAFHLGFMITFALLALWGAVDVCLRVSRLGFPPKIHDRDFLTNYCVRTCGGTQAEALSRGCLYDHIENRFTRPDCVNPLLNDEFSKLGPGKNGSWVYQVDVHGNGTLTSMETAEMLRSVRPGLRVWQTGRQHTLHCLFVWRRNALSHFDGTIITMDRKELFEHDAHCARMITNRLAGNDLEEYVTVTTYGPLDQEAKDRAEKFFAEQAERLRTGNGVVAPIFDGQNRSSCSG